MAVKNIVHRKSFIDARGEEKNKWTQVGILIEKDGKQYVKLEFLPVACEEDGSFFFSVFDQDQGNRSKKPERPPLSDNAQALLNKDETDFEDDIPF